MQPSVTKLIALRLDTLEALAASYMPVFKHGGIFLPDNESLASCDLSPSCGTLFLILHLPGKTDAIALNAKIAWHSPKPMQGFGLQFLDSTEESKKLIEAMLRGKYESEEGGSPYSFEQLQCK